MKLRDIFALFALSVRVNGFVWAAAVQPVILSLGAMLAAVNLDVLDIQLPSIFKQDDTTLEVVTLTDKDFAEKEIPIDEEHEA